MTLDLSNAEVGDIIVLRCGGGLVIDDIKSRLCANFTIYSEKYVWSNNGSFNTFIESPFDIVALEKPETVDVNF